MKAVLRFFNAPGMTAEAYGVEIGAREQPGLRWTKYTLTQIKFSQLAHLALLESRDLRHLLSYAKFEHPGRPARSALVLLKVVYPADVWAVPYVLPKLVVGCVDELDRDRPLVEVQHAMLAGSFPAPA